MMKLETGTEVRSKKTPAMTAITIGAVKENKMIIRDYFKLRLHKKIYHLIVGGAVIC